MSKALIVGGGIAGPVTAMALQRIGIEATVLEARTPGAAELGSWLTLQANGINALRLVDAHHTVAGIGFPTRTMHFRNGSGRTLGVLANGAETPDGVTSQVVPRAGLYTALRDLAVQRGVHVEFDARVGSARTTSGAVEVDLVDGRTMTADLLIGADGLRSVVRAAIDRHAPSVRYVPVLNLGGHAPGLVTDCPVEQFEMVFGTRCFAGWTTLPDGGTVWFANPPHKQEPQRGELQGIGDAEWRRRLLELFSGDAVPMRQILDGTTTALSGWATYDMPPVPTWHRGRMCLIGDAAHATSPSSGQGASLALEDAITIAMCLRDHDDPAAAFAAFERLRRERVEKIVKLGHRSSNSKAAGPIGRRVRDAILPIVFARVSRNDSAGSRWITDHRIDWDASTRETAVVH